MVTTVSQIDTSLPARVPKSEFVAGRLSLAFCNTVALPTAADRLADPESLAAWAARAGRPLDAAPDAAAFQSLLQLRTLLRDIFGHLANGLAPAQANLDALAGMAAPQRLVWDDRAYRAELRPAGDSLKRLKQALVADALDLLTGEALERIKRCPAHDCRWFFFDTSRNGKRRWCAMGDCGVKDKVQRYRAHHDMH